MQKFVVRREDLTAAEMKAITGRYDGYHHCPEFWDGYADYQNGRWRCPWSDNSVAGQAWDRGSEAAMRVHWERRRCMYARDCLDTRAMCRGLRAGLKKRKAAAAVAD